MTDDPVSMARFVKGAISSIEPIIRKLGLHRPGHLPRREDETIYQYSILARQRGHC
jgi:hypothetical protein